MRLPSYAHPIRAPLTAPFAVTVPADGEIARRNVLFGLWAGRRLGLTGDDLETYAWSVHFADRDRAGRLAAEPVMMKHTAL